MIKFLKKIIGFERRGYQSNTYHFKWGELSWHPRRWDLSLRYCNFGGCESRDMIIFSPLFCSFYIFLSEEYDRNWDDEGFSYGFYVYAWESLVMEWGEKCVYFDFPYITRIWKRTEVFDTHGNLKFVENKGDKNWDERWKISKQIKTPYPYKYTLKNGEVQERIANVHVTTMHWTRKWFPFLKIKRRYIDVEFSDEVGEETGSWKGGCIGCSYELKQGETPEECLRRMEKEREF